jgi:predicted TIM-barrel fold metal-dependent hydrolase
VRDENDTDERGPLDLSDASPAPTSLTTSRRSVLRGAAALGATTLAAAATASPALAADPTGAVDATGGGGSGRIDVHHHAIPPEERQWMVDHGLLPPVGGPPWSIWSVDSALAIMDELGIAAAVLSGPAPSEFLANLSAADLQQGTRIGNDALAQVIHDHPSRFGLFASAPMGNVDVALGEIAYAYDTLHADGICLNMHAAGQYLGDPMFDPILTELNNRRAVVFTHPYNLPGCGAAPVADFLVDFLADTTRAAVKMVLNATLDRFPNIQFILPHGGGYFPLLAARLQEGVYLGAGVSQATATRAIRKLWYDSAMPISPGATPSLLAAVGSDRLLLGTDFPAATADGARLNVHAIDSDPALNSSTRRQLNRDNARRLLPALAARMGG